MVVFIIQRNGEEKLSHYPHVCLIRAMFIDPPNSVIGRKAHLLEDKQIPSVGVFDEHLECIWRKYTHFGLNLGRNEPRLQLYSKILKIWFIDRGDGVRIHCDAVKVFKGRLDVHGEASTSQPKETVHTNTHSTAKMVSSKSDDILMISFKNSFDALKDRDDMFETDKSYWQKSNNIKSTVNDGDSEEIENVLWKIMGNRLIAWLMMHIRWRLLPRRLKNWYFVG
nr:hypothetical protein [Tanacetum cinerariifolium]